MIEYLGIVGMLIGMWSFVPQINRIRKFKSAKDFSWSFLCLSVFSVISVFLYAIEKNTDIFIIQYYLYLLLVFVIMIFQKFYYENYYEVEKEK